MPKRRTPPIIDTLEAFHAVDHEELLSTGEQIFVSVQIAAHLLNVSERRIRQLVDEGMPSFWDRDGLRIRWPAAVRWRDRQLFDAGVRRAAGVHAARTEWEPQEDLP